MKFSVLLSVYFKADPEQFDAAFDSIWHNQKLKPNQIVLVKDGPLPKELSDRVNTWARILEEHLTVVEIKKNVGLGTALNEGLKYCHYDLVARMDTDDISMPDRFNEQISFMTKNPDISVCSGYIEEWDENMATILSHRPLPLTHESIAKFSARRSPISHPAVMFRTNSVLNVGGYPDYYPEDYALWVKMIYNGYRFANLENVLLRMRTGEDFYKRRGLRFLKGEVLVMLMQLKYNMITKKTFLVNVSARLLLRASPPAIRKFAYKKLR